MPNYETKNYIIIQKLLWSFNVSALGVDTS